MTAEPDTGTLAPRAAHPPPGPVFRSGAELVALSERFYGGVFVGAVGFVGLAALATLVLFPTRNFPAGAPVTPAFVATALIVVASVLAVWRAREVYRTLRRWPQLQLGLVAVAAALVASPELTSGLWWPSCAILMALALVVPLRRTLVYCLLVLGTNLAGHLVARDLDDIHPVDIIGLWIGFPLWLMAVAVVTDRLSSYILLLNAPPAAEAPREPLRRVDVSSSPDDR